MSKNHESCVTFRVNYDKSITPEVSSNYEKIPKILVK